MGAPFFGPSTGDITTTIDGRTGAAKTQTTGYRPELNFSVLTPWDVITLGSTLLYRVKKLQAEKGGKIDNKGAIGMSGAQPSHLGYAPAPIVLELEIWTEDGFKNWERVIPALVPRHGKKIPQPIDVIYPSLSQLGIRQLFPTKVGVLEPTGKNGIFQVRVEFSEFAPLINSGPLTFTGSLTDTNPARSPQQQPVDPSSNQSTVGPK